MSEERLDELREILYNPNLKGYLPNVCNELLQQVTKQKEVIEQLKNSQYCPYDKKCGKLYECTKQEYEDMCNANMKLSLENDNLRYRLENATADCQLRLKEVRKQKENEILKENVKNNDKVVDKVNWENQLLQQENQELKKQLKPDYYTSGLEGTLKEYQQEMNKVVTQQKEFIKFLEDNWKETQDIWYLKVLYKYEEIIGVKDGK